MPAHTHLVTTAHTYTHPTPRYRHNSNPIQRTNDFCPMSMMDRKEAVTFASIGLTAAWLHSLMDRSMSLNKKYRGLGQSVAMVQLGHGQLHHVTQVVDDALIGPPMTILIKDVMRTLHQLQSDAVEFGDPQEPNQESQVNLQGFCDHRSPRQHTHPTEGADDGQNPWSKPPGKPLTSMVWYDLLPEDSALWGNMVNQGRLTITS
jgi:hypothetical protein